jgi:indole-3-glycerol phosphate synthase
MTTTKNLVPTVDTIIAAKRQYLAERKAKTPIEAVRALASMQKRPQPILSTVSNDGRALVIGRIVYSMLDKGPDTYDPVGTALRYARARVDAVALFTDMTIYQGGLDDLMLVSRAVNIPVISQDYILEEYQVVETRAAGASAVILSSSVLDRALLRTLVSASQRNRMTAIVQVENEDELAYALSLSPHVIGLSKTDPDSRRLDMDAICRLRPMIPHHIRVMITDPLESFEDVKTAASLRVDAIMVSDALLSDGDKIQRLQTMLNPARSNGDNS